MYLDDPAPAYKRVREPVQGLLMFASALIVSPLGYLLIDPLGRLADQAAASLL
jgi:NADH-quinone oxidoreductase subunit N